VFYRRLIHFPKRQPDPQNKLGFEKNLRVETWQATSHFLRRIVDRRRPRLRMKILLHRHSCLPVTLCSATIVEERPFMAARTILPSPVFLSEPDEAERRTASRRISRIGLA
jgi:hypothetical protein